MSGIFLCFTDYLVVHINLTYKNVMQHSLGLLIQQAMVYKILNAKLSQQNLILGYTAGWQSTLALCCLIGWFKLQVFLTAKIELLNFFTFFNFGRSANKNWLNEFYGTTRILNESLP